MGTVYLCEHVQLRRRYALKVLNPGHNAEVEQRFLQEAQAASRIDQENVVDVLDYGEDPDGELFYVMEALYGRSLTQVLRDEGPLPVARALGLLEQVCRALVAAHERGVIHRDVKPDNVFVEKLASGVERAKLIDFGISHVPGNSRLTVDGEIIGTPEYMAPEQASGAAVDPLSDVYAAGVLAYEVLTGLPPLSGGSAAATLAAHRDQIPTAPSELRPGIPPEVDRLVLRALAKRPGDRYASMAALMSEVTRVRHLSSLSWASAGAVDRGGAARGAVVHGSGMTLPLPAISAARHPVLVRGEQPLWGRLLVLVTILTAVALVVVAWLAWRQPAPAPGPTPPPSVAGVAGQGAAAPPTSPMLTATPAAPALAATQAGPPAAQEAPVPAETVPASGPGPRPKATRRLPEQPAASSDVKDPYATEPDPLKANPFR
jgi:serine/threonine-protein kinase